MCLKPSALFTVLVVGLTRACLEPFAQGSLPFDASPNSATSACQKCTAAGPTCSGLHITAEAIISLRTYMNLTIVDNGVRTCHGENFNDAGSGTTHALPGRPSRTPGGASRARS
ncbi:hypothetical protein DFH09DRAFT_130458 [Mycena vulgaris]|nr:hypothetical protein DFH09DRAFT_130458 [Mycena vulgaris]